MLILFYPPDSAGEASKKIDEIRAAYDKTFRQESVLREDEQSPAWRFELVTGHPEVTESHVPGGIRERRPS